MELCEIVSKMSKLYLGRLIDSFMKDVNKDNEEKMRNLLTKNIEEFADYDRIENKLDFVNADRNIRLLNELILQILLNEQDYILNRDDLIEKVKEKEEEIVEESEKDDALKYSDEESLEIYEKVLKTAWKWQDDISPHEQNILDVLKEELDLSTYEHRILESKLGYFPQPQNQIHGVKKIKNSLKDLQYRGLVARIYDGAPYYVIPEEIARTIKEILGIELHKDSYTLLLKKLTRKQLKKVLRGNDLLVSGTKEEKCDRILQAKIKPSDALKELTSDELSEILRTLDNVKISGTKNEKINNLIDFYDDLVIYPPDGTDEREQYFNYLVELAERDYEQLRGNNIIEKDKDIERKFEEGTRYLFEEKLGIEPTEMKGNEVPDGRLKFNKNDVLLWDNKSCEHDYDFPEKHFNQFLSYIRKENKRVNLFLIVAPSFSDDCINNAHRLKAESPEDSDIALITAEEIQFVAENWQDYSSSNNPDDLKFNLQVFNFNGRLTKERLIQRMEWAIE